MNLSKLIFLISLIASVAVTSCIEDGFTTSPSAQPTFSVDTLDMGVIFTGQPSTTHRMVVYNRADKGITISRIALAGAAADLFRINVDGFSGSEFSDIEIRGGDSILILVATTLPPNGLTVPDVVEASIDFTTAGVRRSVAVTATGRDVVRLHGPVYEQDTHLTADRPYQIFDSLVVAPGATLTLDPGAELYFHDGAYMAVRGTLLAEGDAGREIQLAGDRTGFVAADIPFDLLSRQWAGLIFTGTSRGSRMAYCHVRNTSWGVTVDGSTAPDGHVPDLTVVNSRLRNSGDYSLASIHSRLTLIGTEVAEAALGAVILQGGQASVTHCTLTNYYLFAAPSQPILQLSHFSDDTADGSGRPYLTANIDNTIIYGLGADISHGDLTGSAVVLRNCLFKSNGSDDDWFTNCVWGADPLFRTVREEYIFDYTLRPESPAIGAADPALTPQAAATDRLGHPRGQRPDIGAYVYTPEE